MGGSEALALDARAELIFDMTPEQFSNSDRQFYLALKTQFTKKSCIGRGTSVKHINGKKNIFIMCVFFLNKHKFCFGPIF